MTGFPTNVLLVRDRLGYYHDVTKEEIRLLLDKTSLTESHAQGENCVENCA
jgi:hypothetical protein